MGHKIALQEALDDIQQHELTAEKLEGLTKDDRRLLDQFAYRYTRLQDDMGNRLMPATLQALGEEIAAMPVFDRLNRLEQLAWLPSAEEWVELRRIRNEFAHDYPETTEARFNRLQQAFNAARRALEILEIFSLNIRKRFPEATAGD
jgi:uncharacterized protein with HEPN domain